MHPGTPLTAHGLKTGCKFELAYKDHCTRCRRCICSPESGRFPHFFGTLSWTKISQTGACAYTRYTNTSMFEFCKPFTSVVMIWRLQGQFLSLLIAYVGRKRGLWRPKIPRASSTFHQCLLHNDELGPPTDLPDRATVHSFQLTRT